MHTPGNEHLSKAEWRARVAADRASVPPRQHAREALALAETASRLPGETLCGYLPFGSEPGSITLVEALRAGGARVLLPVIPAGPGPLDWAEYTGCDTLVTGRLRGVLEPAGPPLGPAAIADADLVLVPALAVDHGGVRLGRGAGYYDRSLIFATPNTALVAVVRDSELVERLPAEGHDFPVTGALTPGQGLIRLPVNRPG